MKIPRRVLGIGGVILLLVAATWPVARRQVDRIAEPGTIVLRLAHMSLDPPVHRAFDALAAEFQQQHPNVRIEQMPVPQRLYRTWLSTQLTGGSPPDIVEVPPWAPVEQVMPYFEEIGRELHQPNPANAGTVLATMPWHETFVNGLRDQPNFYEPVLGYYSVPMSVITLRLVYNRELLKTTCGVDRPPRTVDELAGLCARIKAHGLSTGEHIIPLVVAGWKADTMLRSVVSSRTAELSEQFDLLRAGWNWDEESTVAYLRGRWSLASPELRGAFDQMRELGRHFPPGFQQLTDGDAAFPFMQGQAVFYVALSGEFTTLLSQCQFPLGVTLIPKSDAETARKIAEGNLISMASLGITQQSAHKALAMEFLQFITSRTANEKFCRLSNWLPSVRGLDTAEQLVGFSPDSSGDPPGFGPWLLGDPDLTQFINQNLYHLLSAGGSVDEFEAVLKPAYPDLVSGAIRRFNHRVDQITQRLDIALAARDRLNAANAEFPSGKRDEADHLFEVEVISTLRTAYMQQALRDATKSP